MLIKMKMLKRQNSLLSSSSCRRETPPPLDHHNRHAAKSTGCMSPIFHLLSKYQNRRKFLTSGKRQENRDTSKKHRQKQESRDVGRSPTIQSDIRLLPISPENTGSPQVLVPRQMGFIKDVPGGGSMNHYYSTSTIISSTTNDTSSLEKRRKLMSDINKCDQDLQELKKSIQAIQVGTRVHDAEVEEEDDDDEDSVNIILKDDQPSPVSVLHHELARPPLISPSGYTTTQTAHGRRQLPQAPKLVTSGKKEGEDDTYDWLFFQKVRVKSLQAWTSKAMANSVEEVCEDIDLGGKKEVGKVGEVIHECICEDLIEEVVKDMGLWCTEYSLPFLACQRRLCF